MTRPAVIYVLSSAGHLSGGVRVICEHITRLTARGWPAELWLVQGAPSWFPRPVPYRLFGSTDALGAALQRLPSEAITVATVGFSWDWLPPNRPQNGRMFGLLQDFDFATYQGRPDLDARNFQLPLKVIAEGTWLTEELKRRHGVTATNVGLGLDDRYHGDPPAIRREPFRILTQARGSSGGPQDLKGWGLAQSVVAEAHRRDPRISLVTFSTGPHVAGPAGVPHIQVRSPDDAKVHELYAQAGVFLMTSRHEGFGLLGLEALASGCPLVTTDAHGNREYAIHGATALVGSDATELATHCLRSLRRSEAIRAMTTRGQALARTYRWEQVIDRLETLFGGI